MRARIARKEAKETIYWLELTDSYPQDEQERAQRIDKATQLMKILGAIVRNFEKRRHKKPENR